MIKINLALRKQSKVSAQTQATAVAGLRGIVKGFTQFDFWVTPFKWNEQYYGN